MLPHCSKREPCKGEGGKYKNAQKVECSICGKAPNKSYNLWGTDGTDGGKWKPWESGKPPSVRTLAAAGQESITLEKLRNEKEQERARSRGRQRRSSRRKKRGGADSRAPRSDSRDPLLLRLPRWDPRRRRPPMFRCLRIPEGRTQQAERHSRPLQDRLVRYAQLTAL